MVRATPLQPASNGSERPHPGSQSTPFTDYYDADAVAAVQKAFRWELEYFGYQLG